jgi:large subunit ribosomal protein L22
MSTMTKSNERPGVRARLSDARFSAYKAREVLDLIRGKAVGEARTILQFCERGAAEPIMKLLDSAVANAGNNNDIPPEELYVGACYADEGPTLKRWRPRARGRATRIRKRTCHITIIVSRYSAAEMDELRARAERRGRVSSDARADRARRVARSRAPQGADETEAEELAAATAEADTDDAVVEQAAAELAEQEPADQEPTEQTDADEAVADEAVADEAATEAVVDEANADDEDAGAPPADDSPEAEADEAAAEAVTEQGVRGDDEDDEES